MAIEQQLADLPEQISNLRMDANSGSRQPTSTLVIGGLQTLEGVPAATTWLNRILANMNGPRHVGTYSKSNDWMGLLWVKFQSVAGRDMVVGLIRSPAIKMCPNNVWATQELPVPVKAKKVFPHMFHSRS